MGNPNYLSTGYLLIEYDNVYNYIPMEHQEKYKSKDFDEVIPQQNGTSTSSSNITNMEHGIIT